MPPVEAPLVTCAHDGRRLSVAAANAAAGAFGLRPGMPLAQARTVLPGLEVAEADPDGDAAALAGLAAWALRYAPLTAPDPPDGIWIDAAGSAHLHGGEAAMLDSLLARLGRAGYAARAAVADTPGAAWAVARHAAPPASVVAAGAQADALALLPVRALRLPGEVADALRRLGLDLVGQLAALPRAPLARRFGAAALLRLDQALGRAPEPIRPVVPPDAVQPRLAFAEPLLTAESLAAATDRLTGAACAALERAGLGARRLDLIFERVDDAVQILRIGTARPTRDAAHLARLLRERLETVEPGFGVEAMRLVVAWAEPLAPAQSDAALAGAAEAGVGGAGLAALVDRLANRFGPARVFRTVPAESEVPERSVRRVPAEDAAPRPAPALPGPRPVRLLAPPHPVQVVVALPDHPPAVFTWRRARHRVRRADGPERIHGEWWRRDGEVAAVRDYWAVEDEAGRRFWLFRRGDGRDPATGDLAWFLHGLF